MKRNILRITLALILASIMMIGSFSAVSAASGPYYLSNSQPTSGHLTLIFGCKDTDVPIYGYFLGIYRIGYGIWWGHTEYWGASPVNTFKAKYNLHFVLIPGEYEIRVFYRANIGYAYEIIEPITVK